MALVDQDPLKQGNDGVLLDVEVTPGAAQDAFPAGYNRWRGRIQARVQAQAQDGAANQALCQLVAEHLDVPARDVQITRGQTSRQKTLLVRGLEIEALRGRLGEVADP